MSTSVMRRAPKKAGLLGPRAAGIRMTPRAFDAADFVEGWRYELIDGVLVVSPSPLEDERDPNEELGHWLRTYRESHPQGHALNGTVSEQTIRTAKNRRLADRVIWAGLRRRPYRRETPTIIAEFVSEDKRDQHRDYKEKSTEYLEMRVTEYWVIDRFERTMTVFTRGRGKTRRRLIREHETYKTPLLPGFELPLAKLLAIADQWADRPDDDI